MVTYYSTQCFDESIDADAVLARALARMATMDGFARTFRHVPATIVRSPPGHYRHYRGRSTSRTITNTGGATGTTATAARLQRPKGWTSEARGGPRSGAALPPLDTSTGPPRGPRARTYLRIARLGQSGSRARSRSSTVRERSRTLVPSTRPRARRGVSDGCLGTRRHGACLTSDQP